MNPRRFAMIGGVFMLIWGVLALIPSLSENQAVLPGLKLETSYGLFLGMFAMNIVNKLALIVLGLWGIAAGTGEATNLPASIRYSRIVFFAMGVLAILGLIPQTSTLGGYWPLFGNNVYEHAVFAVVGAYFGWALSTRAHEDLKTRPQAKRPAHGI
jgi:hypothetical protein